MSTSPVQNTSQNRSEVHPRALDAAKAFYNQLKSACHGITRRGELCQLYQRVFDSIQHPKEGLDRDWNNYERLDDDMKTPHFFNLVLYALAHGMRVVRVVDNGQKLLWAANRPRPLEYRHPLDDRQPRRPHYQDRRPNYNRDDRRRPNYNRDDRRPRYDQQDRQDRRPRQQPRQENQDNEMLRALQETVERQQAMLDTFTTILASKQE